MARIEIYTSEWCPFCWRAKNLLKNKGLPFDEVNVDGDAALRRAMSERAGGRTTVPQIFIDGAPVGGSDELVMLDASGDLDRMVGGAG